MDKLKRKDLLGLRGVGAEEIELVLDTADQMKRLLNQGIKKLPNLQGKTVVTLFYENSTRTRTSFELAAKYMSAVQVNLPVSASSVAKGETLIDTGRTLDAMKTDVMIIRHQMAGAPALLAKNVSASVINGGDGVNEHPTQALLDMMTIREKFGSFQGLKVAILGDVRHSRVAKSNLFGLKTMGAEVTFFSPKTLELPEADRLGANVARSKEEAIAGADVVMGLRVQLERQKVGYFPTISEYHRFYGVTDRELRAANEGAIVMHPGPVNRGVEFTSAVIDGEASVIEEQVLSGVAVRMALLQLLTRK